MTKKWNADYTSKAVKPKPARVTVLMDKLQGGKLKLPAEQRELYAIIYGMSLAENRTKIL